MGPEDEVGRLLPFAAAGGAFALPASAVREVHDLLALEGVAGTRPWFLGTASVAGRLVPVTDFSAWFGGPPATGRIIELAPAIGIAALRVDAVPATGTERADARLSASITRSIVSIDGRAHRLLDARALLVSPGFVEIGLPSGDEPE